MTLSVATKHELLIDDSQNLTRKSGGIGNNGSFLLITPQNRVISTCIKM